MSQNRPSDGLFSDTPSQRLPRRQRPDIFQQGSHGSDFPIEVVEINWDRLRAKRAMVLTQVDAMPAYLLMPEVLALLEMEMDATYRLILDLMWNTGARISEVLALKPTSFVDDGYDYSVLLNTLKQRPGRPSKRALARSAKRHVPIADPIMRERIERYLHTQKFKKEERIFTMHRSSVNRHLDALVARTGGAPFRVTPHTFRHSFAIHLLLHGRPLKYIGQLLGHRSIESTEIYTNVLTLDAAHLLDGVGFH